MSTLHLPMITYAGWREDETPAEPLGVDEEVDFLADVAAAVESGELSQGEANAMIDREYEVRSR